MIPVIIHRCSCGKLPFLSVHCSYLIFKCSTCGLSGNEGVSSVRVGDGYMNWIQRSIDTWNKFRVSSDRVLIKIPDRKEMDDLIENKGTSIFKLFWEG